jgi:hypothetical protein
MRSVSNSLRSKQLISSLKCAERLGENTKYRLSGAEHTVAPATPPGLFDQMLAIPFTPDEPSTQGLPILLSVFLRELFKSPLHVPPMFATQDLDGTFNFTPQWPAVATPPDQHLQGPNWGHLRRRIEQFAEVHKKKYGGACE